MREMFRNTKFTLEELSSVKQNIQEARKLVIPVKMIEDIYGEVIYAAKPRGGK